MIEKIIYKKNTKTNEFAEFMENSIIADAEDWIDCSKEDYDNSLLPSIKIVRKQYIIKKRSDLTDKGTLEYNGNTYSNAQSAKTAILNYIVSLNDINKGGYLTYPEQKFVELSKVEFQELALSIQKNELSLRQRQSVALQAIESATTIEEINSIEL